MASFLGAHGYDPGPTQRPLLAGAVVAESAMRQLDIDELDVDLIVVGSRHKRFFERLVEGSVNQDVLRRAGCDVLVVY